MTNELSVVPLEVTSALGKIFAESGLFTDVKSQSQAVVRILAGQEIGIPAFAAISGIHIIQGKPTIGAGLMASRVKGSGKYDYKVKEHSEKICSIDFFQLGGTKPEMIGNSTFTIEEAKKAGTKNLDKFPKNMLFARALSNGVKFFTPDIFAGPVYTPEEMANVTEDVQAEVTNVWQPTAEEMQELSDLVDNSTLEGKRKEAARIAITECKTQKEVDKIKAALLKSQSNG
jgi:hypothetical protein